MREPQGVASLALGYVLHWAFSPPLLNPKLELHKQSQFATLPTNIKEDSSQNQFVVSLLYVSRSVANYDCLCNSSFGFNKGGLKAQCST